MGTKNYRSLDVEHMASVGSARQAVSPLSGLRHKVLLLVSGALRHPAVAVRTLRAQDGKRMSSYNDRGFYAHLAIDPGPYGTRQWLCGPFGPKMEYHCRVEPQVESTRTKR
jgi:hypothetical protein